MIYILIKQNGVEFLIEPLHDNKVVIGVGINLNPMPHTIDNQEVTDLKGNYHFGRKN